MLISEDASRMFGFSSYDDAIGKVIFIGSRRFEVIGVVGNYHYRTLQTRIEPVLYMQNYPTRSCIRRKGRGRRNGRNHITT